MYSKILNSQASLQKWSLLAVKAMCSLLLKNHTKVFILQDKGGEGKEKGEGERTRGRKKVVHNKRPLGPNQRIPAKMEKVYIEIDSEKAGGQGIGSGAGYKTRKGKFIDMEALSYDDKI